MILYLDASALVKRYVAEPGSVEVQRMIGEADVVGTAIITRAEVAAALSKAVRMAALSPGEAQESLKLFRNEWPDLVRIQVTEMVVARADIFAWEHGLRGYDAVHLAAASLWRDALGGDRVMFLTFDRKLWTAVQSAGLVPAPTDLPALLAMWKQQSGLESRSD